MTEFPPPEPSGTPLPGMVTPSGAVAPQGGPVSKQNNWQGVLALVSSLTVVGGVMGVIFGAIGLQSVKARTATNRNVALAGLVLGGLLSVAGIVAIVGVAAFAWGTPPGSTYTRVEDLGSGDCFAEHGTGPESDEDVDVAGIYTVDCASAHYGEVYFVGALPLEPYPGEDAVIEQVEVECSGLEATAGVDLDKAGDLWLSFMYPTEGAWEQSDSGYVCVVYADGETLIGSVLLEP